MNKIYQMRQILLLNLVLIIFLFSCNRQNLLSNVQIIPTNHSPSDSLVKEKYIFPKDWLGKWSGDLKIYNAQGLKQTVPMALDLSISDTMGVYTWAIIYGEDSLAQRREYQLIAIDSSKGHYLIDEKNGIVLDAFHIHNELTSIFEVMGNTLLTSYMLEEKDMIFSVKVFPSEKIRVSGDTLMANEEIPAVSSFHHTINQVARLQKKCLVE